MVLQKHLNDFSAVLCVARAGFRVIDFFFLQKSKFFPLLFLFSFSFSFSFNTREVFAAETRVSVTLTGVFAAETQVSVT